MNLQSILGILVIFGLMIAFSRNRSEISYRIFAIGFLFQMILAFILIKTTWLNGIFSQMTHWVEGLQYATQQGTSLVFGYLSGQNLPFETVDSSNLFILGIQGLPLVIVVGALSSLLYYWRILPWIIKIIGRVFAKVFGVGGPVSLGSAANLFLGLDGAPMMVAPHLKRMTNAELFAFMTVGLATVAGTVMVLYAYILGGLFDHVLGHIFAASLLNVFSTLLLAQLFFPMGKNITLGEIELKDKPNSMMDAIAKGTQTGTQVLISIIAFLIVMVALVSIVNQLLAIIPWTAEPVTLSRILGYIFAPFMWLMGVGSGDMLIAGELMGTKVVLNEILAYSQLASYAASDAVEISSSTQMILIYALCGFANFGSVGITIGVLTTLVPERRADILKMVVMALWVAVLANMLTGTVVAFWLG